MPSRSRRTLLRTSVATLSVGLGGCLGMFESYPSAGILIINGDDESRTVPVKIMDTDDTMLFETTYTIPARERLERENIVDTGPIRVEAYVGDRPSFVHDEYFDFSGCQEARLVITIDSNRVSRIGKQDTC